MQRIKKTLSSGAHLPGATSKNPPRISGKCLCWQGRRILARHWRLGNHFLLGRSRPGNPMIRSHPHGIWPTAWHNLTFAGLSRIYVLKAPQGPDQKLQSCPLQLVLEACRIYVLKAPHRGPGPYNMIMCMCVCVRVACDLL